jgi:GT2 family glycosyltransferase
MNTFDVDIIVSVWNRPIETRNCLVNLAQHSPRARFILVDNGCDREAERLLQEFAEILDDRAFLLRTDVNQGVIKAVNRGLARAEAPYVMVVRNTSIVTGGWLEPMMEFAESRADAGVIIPRLIENHDGSGKTPKLSAGGVREVSHGSFAAMLIKRELYERIGGLDEEMDGGLWCLKDYSRRAYRAGFLTFAVEGGVVYCSEEISLGSAARREEALKRSVARFTERWGEERAFCVYMPKDVDLGALRQKLDMMLKGARHGHRFFILVHPALHRETVKAGCTSLHGNMIIEALPRLFTAGGLRKAIGRCNGAMPGTRTVMGIDGLTFPGMGECMTFSDLERSISATEAERYGHR